ncbi:hypothetical protein CYY_001750 [Polysphondylium violaceum]|uniref:Man1/Src1-like C-terminal domain-containing protein n=1 Tax=Polysphondylium violaceum TaxID=133409 RepID=A0A8J4Q2S7_9MYCE|nr:hypothetical protein CYY_001750 [Polysphondylium violaceum]
MSDLSKPDSKIREKKKTSIAAPPSLTNSTSSRSSASSSSFSNSLIRPPSQFKSSLGPSSASQKTFDISSTTTTTTTTSTKTLKPPIISTTTVNEDELAKKNRRKSFGGTPSKDKSTTTTTSAKDDGVEKKKSLKRKSIESGNIFQFDSLSSKDSIQETSNDDTAYIKKLKSLIDSKTAPSSEEKKKSSSSSSPSDIVEEKEKKPRRLSVGVKSSSKPTKVKEEKVEQQEEEQEEQEKPRKSKKQVRVEESSSEEEESKPRRKSTSQSSVVVAKKKDKLPTTTATSSSAKDLKEKEKKKKKARLSTTSTTTSSSTSTSTTPSKRVSVSNLLTVDDIQKQEKQNQIFKQQQQDQQEFDPSSSVIGTTSNIPTKVHTKSYPKTPLPKANSNNSAKYHTPLQSLPSTPATHRSVMSTSSYQYPASPLPPMEGFEYSDSPVSIPNISYLSPSEKDISFETDEPLLDEDDYNYQILDSNNNNNNNKNNVIKSFAPPPATSTTNRKNRQQQQSSSPILSSIKDLDRENWFKYVLVVISFIFWAIILFTLFGFYYHFNDVKYCDTDMIPERINGRYQCQVCPDKGICMKGSFVDCTQGYVKRNNQECILDPSKVQNLVNAITNIDNILRDRKGKYECGTQPSLYLNFEELKKEFSSRYWIGNKDAMESFSTVMNLIDTQNDPEDIGIDKKLTNSIGFIFEDNEFKYYSDQDSIRPLWCQSLFFCKRLLMNYLPLIGLLLMGVALFKYYQYSAKKKQQDLLMIEKSTKKILDILQQRKAHFEEPWISEIILRDEVIGSEKNKRLDKIWEKTLENLYQNRRVISTPKLVHGESQLTFEWIDANPTPKKVDNNNNYSNNISFDD